MPRGFKKDKEAIRPPEENQEMQKTSPEILETPEIDPERINDPEYVAGLLDKQAEELRFRQKMLQIQLENGLIDDEKYAELEAELKKANEDFINKLEEAEEKFGPELPPVSPDRRPLQTEFMEAQMQYLVKFEADVLAKRRMEEGNMPPEEYQQFAFDLLDALASRDAVVAEMDEATRRWAGQLIEADEKSLSAAVTLAPKPGSETLPSLPGSETIPPLPEDTPEREPGPFDGVQSFEELDALIRGMANEKGWVEGFDYKANDLIDLITDVRDGHSEINQISRTGGLRDKVVQLLEKETPKPGLQPGEIELNKPQPAPEVQLPPPLPKVETAPLTAEEIEKRLKFAKDTYRPLDTAYWEQEKAALAERAKAEAAAIRSEQVYDGLRQAYSELSAADLDPARRKELKSIVKDLEKERDKLTGRTWGAKFKKLVSSGYDKVVAGFEAAGRKVLSVAEAIKLKMKKALPKYAERLLTSATFGWWDVHQAEKFRTATKATAEDVQLLAGAIRQEKGQLTEDEALREAQEMARLFETSERVKSAGAPKTSDYEAASDAVSVGKHAENSKKENEIVAFAMNQLKYKLETSSWFMKYRTARGGEGVLTPEATGALEAKIRERLRAMRDGQTANDIGDYKKLIRESLDPHYWNRYIYGGIALALNSIGLAYGLAPGAPEAAASKAAEAGASAGGTAAVEAAKQAAEIGLKDTIWAEAQRQLVQQGIERPTDAMIQQVATEIAKESGVEVISKATGEVLWQQTAGGVAKDIALQKGFLLKLGAGLKKIAALKAAIAA